MARSGATARSAPHSGDGARFVLDGDVVGAGDVSPLTTVPEFLRAQLGHTGSQEGCAEGDCGACSVVPVGRGGGDLRWRPVNACIRLLSTIDGKALLTAEKPRFSVAYPIGIAGISGREPGILALAVAAELVEAHERAAARAELRVDVKARSA